MPHAVVAAVAMAWPLRPRQTLRQLAGTRVAVMPALAAVQVRPLGVAVATAVTPVAVPVPRAAVRAALVARRMVKLGVAAQGVMEAPVGTAVWAWPRPMRTRRCRLVARAPVVKSDRRAEADRAVAVETDRFLSAVVAAEAVAPEVLQPRARLQVAVAVDRLDCGQSALNV